MGVGVLRVNRYGLFERADRLSDGAQAVDAFVGSRPLSHRLSVDRIGLGIMGIQANRAVSGPACLIGPLFSLLRGRRMAHSPPIGFNQSNINVRLVGIFI